VRCPISKIDRSRGFVAPVLALAAAGIVWALMGCGDFSLVDALQTEAPGNFRLSPDTALVPEATAFTFMVLGGFLPYEVGVGGALTSEYDHDYVFNGGTVPAGTTRDYPIEATDHLGNTASALAIVYVPPSVPLALNVQSLTLLEGDSWDFEASGGEPPYVWSLDGQPQYPDDNKLYPFPNDLPPSDYTVSVSDSIGVARAAIVKVIPLPPLDSPLEISPTSATVLVGGRVVFTALGGSGSYIFTASGGTITPEPDGSPATYIAPAVKDVYTIEASDTGGSPPATATVKVVASPNQALGLVPDSPTVSAVGAKIEFTAVDGTPEYVFSTDHPAWASIVPTGAATALYTQLPEGEGRNVMVRVTDADGTSTSTMVKWK
jgi:hypothetical protein